MAHKPFAGKQVKLQSSVLLSCSSLAWDGAWCDCAILQLCPVAACNGPRLCRDGQAADQERSKGRPAKPDRVCCDCAVFRRRSHRYCSPSHVDQIWCTCSQTALHYATKLANIELMHMLFEKNADPNVADKQGYVH